MVCRCGATQRRATSSKSTPRISRGMCAGDCVHERCKDAAGARCGQHRAAQEEAALPLPLRCVELRGRMGGWLMLPLPL
eukprot:361687-Chlamydomonas_euryale.AAC.1